MTQIAPDHRAGISAQASTLCDEIDAEPGAGLLIDIIGPGGCGKTPLIEAAARHYAKAGVPVTRDCRASGDLNGASVVQLDTHAEGSACGRGAQHDHIPTPSGGC